jgi:cytosolic carboxypeptidase protein 6
VFPAALAALAACAPASAPPGDPRPAPDPPSSADDRAYTITVDRPIEAARQRTIGFLDHGVWFSSELPGGRLDDLWREQDTLYVARLRPENAPINNSAWYAFKAWSHEPRTVAVRLTYEDGRHRYWPKATRAGQDWAPLPPEAVRVDTADQSATFWLAVGPDTVWVAGQELITARDFARWTDSLAVLPHVSREVIGRSRLGRPIEMLTITENPSAAREVLLISRQHPPEITGTLALLRFVEEVAGDSPLARSFRGHFQVRVVPVVNPDGVDLGHWRHNMGGVDLNRDWVAFRQPETRAVRDAFLELAGRTGAEIWFAGDFHSTRRDVFYTLDRELETTPPGFIDRWLEGIAGRLPGYEIDDAPSGLDNSTSRNWFYREFGAPAVTYEVGDDTDPALIREVATAAARAMMELLLADAGVARTGP